MTDRTHRRGDEFWYTPVFNRNCRTVVPLDEVERRRQHSIEVMARINTEFLRLILPEAEFEALMRGDAPPPRTRR